MKLFSYDGPLVTGINRLIDYILLGLLWMVASLPVVTYGAATTAMLFTAEVCLHKGEGKLFHTFRQSFRREFKQATLLWLIVAAVSALLLVDAYVLSTIKLPDAVLTLLFVMATTLRMSIVTIRSPHSSPKVAITTSESAANTFFIQPLPAPIPRSPPDARHISALVCW